MLIVDCCLFVKAGCCWLFVYRSVFVVVCRVWLFVDCLLFVGVCGLLSRVVRCLVRVCGLSLVGCLLLVVVCSLLLLYAACGC